MSRFYRRPSFEGMEPRLALTIFTVTSLADGPADLRDNVVTLRDAIAAANNNVPAFPGGPAGSELLSDSIGFQAGLSGRITLTQGPLNPRGGLSINGPGSDVITVDGVSIVGSVFNVTDLTNRFTFISIRGLTITRGDATEGGGIFNRENLTLENVVVTGNRATRGGGLFNAGRATIVDSRFQQNDASGSAGGISNAGTLTLRNSLVARNSGLNGAGGIKNEGSLTIRESTIADNHAGSLGIASIPGGGLLNDGTGVATIQNSTISGNQSDSAAGVENLGVMTMENATVSGNSALLSFGGVHNSGTLTLRNSTIAANRASIVDNPGHRGAGLYNEFASVITMHNTILANNVNGSGGAVAENYGGGAAHAASSRNLIGPGDSSGLSNGGPNGNLVGVVEAMLGALADNGGPTQTHALLSGSPAINAGDNSQVPLDAFDLDGDSNTTEAIPFDQRGTGFARVLGTAVDIGAVEFFFSTTNACDLIPDGVIDASDAAVMFANWGQSGVGDCNGDGIVDAADAAILFAAWTGDAFRVRSALASLAR